MLTWRTDRSRIFPPLAHALDDLLGSAPHSYYAISGERSNEEQADLYEKWIAYQWYLQGGPPAPFAGKAAPPGMSAHNPRGTPPFGCAVDLALDIDALPGLQPSWDKRLPGWKYLAAAIPESHATLKHGRSFGDWPHVEWKAWKKIA